MGGLYGFRWVSVVVEKNPRKFPTTFEFHGIVNTKKLLSKEFWLFVD